MSPRCGCCVERVNKLNQQVSVMRKEIKNLRQMLDNGVRSHRKHVAALQSVVMKMGRSEIESKPQPPTRPPPLQTERSVQIAMEQGSIQTVPIGYIDSCFSAKNGTPRQPTICRPSRAMLRIRQSVFSNPEHALVGLEHYSHIWVIFLFHKNGHLSYKAKVKPPRLNGQRVGVYSTRSPHRPNALGLTLAKLDKIEGDTIHLSDIDMITGTPVMDIKPYIPEYDSPQSRVGMHLGPYESDQCEVAAASLDEVSNVLQLPKDSESPAHAQLNLDFQRMDSGSNDDPTNLFCRDESKTDLSSTDAALCSTLPSVDTPPLLQDLHTVLEEAKTFVTQSDLFQLSPEEEGETSSASDPKLPESMEDSPGPCYGEEAYSIIAKWVREPPVANLEVRFTPHAKMELERFLPQHTSGPPGSDEPRFKFLRSLEEAVAAIRGVLSADPRSVYRRTRCRERLLFFTLDTADITCWFGQGFAEVLQVQPIGHNLRTPRTEND
ncbi:tRNA (adenine(37)-N6)-methyltransferase [Lampris incognitus]|uniref:tRNA (adenine(37)-N6)-methyltransferase n=1 Tax=Lampris incognitus TaxID=2546036 RepID=UPI0024B59411|nr:tRNA (adenine(37)-N6)-methyltransferase [Lampris incognitus]